MASLQFLLHNYLIFSPSVKHSIFFSEARNDGPDGVFPTTGLVLYFLDFFFLFENM